MNEDCLYLNVYAPLTTGSDARRPVMVWFHGGNWTSGAGSDYDGSVLAAKGNVVVVTVNYRLGALGFLALPGQSARAAEGNFGLQDQQAALSWVKRDIAAFGGQPDNVTIFGESVGGLSVCDQMTSPLAAGLFQRAIAESLCNQRTLTVGEAQQTGSLFAESLGCGSARLEISCLRAKSAADILSASASLAFLPTVGGRILPRQVSQAFSSGHYNKVPLILGTNHDEGSLSAAALARNMPISTAQYAAILTSIYGADSHAVLGQYPAARFPSPYLALSAVLTDSFYSCVMYSDEKTLAEQVPVYAYEFNDPNPYNPYPTALPLGAYHFSEVAYVFGTYDRVFPDPPPFTSAQNRLSDNMIAYWSQFAATGSPDAKSRNWPRFHQHSHMTQEFTPHYVKSTAHFARDHQCVFWGSLN